MRWDKGVLMLVALLSGCAPGSIRVLDKASEICVSVREVVIDQSPSRERVRVLCDE